MKKVIQKLIAAGLMVAMVGTMAACSSADTTSSAAASQAPAASSAAVNSTAASGEKLKVTLCVGRKNDLSFQQSAYEGAMRVQKELGDKYEVNVVEMGDDTTKWKSAFYDAADGGANIIVGVGYQNKENFESIPKEYPDTKFILFDQDVDYSSGDLNNVLTVLFDSNQSGYLAGESAAYYAKKQNSTKIGFIGGMENVVVNNFLVGYAEGVKHVDPTMQILTAYVGDFVDTAKAKDLAQAQISQGASVVFQVAGGAGNGVIEACAANNNVKAIGVDSDQYAALAGSNLQPAVMTSSLKRLDNALFKILSDYSKDTGSVPFGKTVTYGLENDAVGIVFNDNLTKCIGDDGVKNVKDALSQIQSGAIKVDSADKMTDQQIKDIVNK